MSQVKFYLIKRGTQKTNLPITLKYTFAKGERLEYYTGLHANSSDYVDKYYTKQKGKPFKSTAQNAEYINSTLEGIRDDVYMIERKAIASGIMLTVQYFKNELDKIHKPEKAALKEAKEAINQPPKMTLMRFFDEYILECKTAINRHTGRPLGKANATKYTNMKNVLNDFKTYRGKEFDFQDIDRKFYNELINFMIEKKDYSVNTYGRAIKFIKTVLHAATDQGYNTKEDFKKVFRGTSEQSDSFCLDENEIQKLYEKDLSHCEKLEKVRDMFIIGCWTGLRFGDFTTIQKSDIDMAKNRIRVFTSKTKHKVVIPIHWMVKAIIEKYEYKLPEPISNQKFNLYLKDAAKEAEINEPFVKKITKGGKELTISHLKHEVISSHCARRSFATNSFKRGIQPYLIMQITGHKTEREFIKYLKISDEEYATMYEQASGWDNTTINGNGNHSLAVNSTEKN